MSAAASSSGMTLPPLQQTVLDDATAAALFRDLAACTKILAVRPKLSATGYIDPAAELTLDGAAAGLSNGALRAVQVRYLYDEREWCDTLLATPNGLRVVRICQEDIAATIETQP